MKKILVVESSPMGEQSVSRRLTKDIVSELLKKHPGSAVTVRDLSRDPLPHATPESLGSASAPVADELLAADIVVVGAPMWNFGVPSGLKAWIDHAANAGKTFAYTAEGPKGLAGGRKVIVASSAGGVYSEGPGRAMDFVTPYLRTFFLFLGIDEVSFVRAEGVALPHLKEGAYDKARGGIAALVA